MFHLQKQLRWKLFLEREIGTCSNAHRMKLAVTFNSVFPQTITLQASEFPVSCFLSQHSRRLLFNKTAHWVNSEHSPPNYKRYWNAEVLLDFAFKCVQKEREDCAWNVTVLFFPPITDRKMHKTSAAFFFMWRD